jgi:hypothetical protein
MSRVPLWASSAVLVAVVATGCGAKVSAKEAARQLHLGSNSSHVTCRSGQGDFAQYDYECKVYWLHPDRILGGASTVGVTVNSTGISFQTAP